MCSMYEPKKKFELVPEGTYDARLIWLIDLGTKEDTYEGVTTLKHKEYLGWELIGTAMEDGRPFMVGQSYTITNGKYVDRVSGRVIPYVAKTSNLSKMLRKWQNVDERVASHITFLGGLCKKQASAQIVVSHKVDEKDPTKTRYILESIKASKKELPAAVNPILMYEVGDPYPDNMPDWAKKVVESCLENNGGIPAKGSTSEDPGPDAPLGGNADDSDVPF